MSVFDPKDILRRAGFKATPGRVRLLELLAREKQPLTVAHITRKLGRKLNEVTLYRALEALEAQGVVKRVEFAHGHAHWELSAARHHHHVVCRSCGEIEDIEIPHLPKPEKEAERRSEKFSVVDAYSLEFFGTCINCK